MGVPRTVNWASQMKGSAPLLSGAIIMLLGEGWSRNESWLVNGAGENKARAKGHWGPGTRRGRAVWLREEEEGSRAKTGGSCRPKRLKSH